MFPPCVVASIGTVAQPQQRRGLVREHPRTRALLHRQQGAKFVDVVAFVARLHQGNTQATQVELPIGSSKSNTIFS